MADRMTPTEIRLALLRNGYRPLPLNGKAPTPKGWQEKFNTGAEEINAWTTTWPNATNTGVLCRHTPFLDIDITSPDAAQAVEDLVRGRFEDEADIVIRIGKPPKRAIPFRTDTPFDKITLSVVAPNRDTSQKVEFLCDGQQCVVDGIHPDTNKPYVWFGKSLTDTPRDQLPCISADQAQELVDDIVTLLTHDHGYRASGKQQKPNGGAGESHAELVRQVLTGENYHTALTSLAWRHVGAGAPHASLSCRLSLPLVRRALWKCRSRSCRAPSKRSMCPPHTFFARSPTKRASLPSSLMKSTPSSDLKRKRMRRYGAS